MKIFISSLLLISLALGQTSFALDAKQTIAALVAERDVASAASTTRSELPTHKTDDSWQAFSKQYAIVLFVSSTCPHCHRFAPIVKEFASHKGLSVYAYSIDGKGLPEYPSPLLATQEVKTKFYKVMSVVVPGVFIVNVNTLEDFFVRVGEESRADFESDMREAKGAILRDKS